MTDVLDPRFELAPGERERLISEGATVSADGMTVTWPESTITGGGFHKTIKVVAREEFLGGNDVTTNAPGSQVDVYKRQSYYLLGALLGKYKKAEVALPGGCNIGTRPIDQHLKGFRALGAQARIEQGGMVAVDAVSYTHLS